MMGGGSVRNLQYRARAWISAADLVFVPAPVPLSREVDAQKMYVFIWFYNVFRLREIASQKVHKPNGSLMYMYFGALWAKIAKTRN